jgi:hypothetical protein
MLSKLRILLSLLMLSKLGKYIRHRFVPYNTTIQEHNTIKWLAWGLEKENGHEKV